MSPATTTTAPVAVWECRAKRCDFTYPDPIGSETVGHYCPARDGRWTTCRRVNLEETKT